MIRSYADAFQVIARLHRCWNGPDLEGVVLPIIPSESLSPVKFAVLLLKNLG